MKQLILHIPHSSNRIPFYDGFIDDMDIINSEILKLNDWHTSDLFYSSSDISIVADYSRIFCDPERFEDDSIEVMAKFGMGVLYTKTDLGEFLRHVTPELRRRILNEYYIPHHNQLSEAVKRLLMQFSKAKIIDCHSFSDTPFKRDQNQDLDRPDFCIGIDSFHTPQLLIDQSIDFFREKGYKVGINIPYIGSIVPLEYYQFNKNVHSIMLEINRKLYLSLDSNEKSANYPEIKNMVKEFIEMIRMCQD